ncbi:MAG: DUF2157 domain-containing protein, partial [Leptospiraceae bacterium]|nr:DUF2157 domain-containing protein [Leptospiraceae bacterium]
MQSEQAFLTQLRTATKRWMQAGLLDERQAAQILDYESRSPQNAAVSAAANSVDSDHAGFQSYIPAILIGIAVLLIGVGLIFFYAANWKWMSPLT